MIERICMNCSKPTNDIVFSLIDNEGSDILQADLSTCGMEVKTINLNDSEQCQSDLKEVFLAIVTAMADSEITVSFIENEEYPRELIYSAMKAYVADLSEEIQAVAAEFDTELEDLEAAEDEPEDLQEEN